MRAWIGVVSGVLLAACVGGGTHEPCDDDEDCPSGRFCRPSVGCDFECRADIDCIRGGGGTCDIERGRCGQSDGGVSHDASPPCDDRACDDGDFCNGLEVCVDGGCSAGAPPCSAGECDEASDTCDPCLDPDRDDDGYDRVACAGRDCDDDDARIPRPEVCDPDQVDEDCNANTVGSPLFDDLDGDGHFPTSCCNDLVCGTDCSDDPASDTNARQRNSDQAETCDGVDNDCDSRIDEGVPTASYWPDADGDGQGDASATPTVSCSVIEGAITNSMDCNDSNPAINTGQAAAPQCGTDLDCDGAPYENVVCAAGSSRSCSACSLTGAQTCASNCSGWPATCPGTPPPSPLRFACYAPHGCSSTSPSGCRDAGYPICCSQNAAETSCWSEGTDTLCRARYRLTLRYKKTLYPDGGTYRLWARFQTTGLSLGEVPLPGTPGPSSPETSATLEFDVPACGEVRFGVTSSGTQTPWLRSITIEQLTECAAG